MTPETVQNQNTTNVGNTESTTPTKIAFSTTGSIALAGNSFVVYLFMRNPKWLSKSHNRCILNLAIADILTALSLFLVPGFVMPRRYYQMPPPNYLARELYCRIIWTQFLPFSLGITSLYTCLVLSLERWLAVTKSLFYKNRFKTKHMNMLILASWIAGFVNEIPVLVIARSVYDQAPIVCRWVIEDTRSSIPMTIALFLGHTFLPFVLIFGAYVDVFRTIRASIRFGKSASNISLNSLKRMKKVSQMGAIASFILVICWCPAQIYFMLSVLGYTEFPEPNTSNVTVILVIALVFLNSCLNPLVYVFSNPAFRKAFN